MLPSPLLGTHWVLTLDGVSPRLDLRTTTEELLDVLGMTVVARRWRPDVGLLVLAESHACIERVGGRLRVDLFSCEPLRLDPADLASIAFGAQTVAGQICPRGPWDDAVALGGSRRRLYAVEDPDTQVETALSTLGLDQGADLFHHFEPHGVTWIRDDGERRAILHTWPEHGLVTLDLHGPWRSAPLPDDWLALAEVPGRGIGQPSHQEAERC